MVLPQYGNWRAAAVAPAKMSIPSRALRVAGKRRKTGEYSEKDRRWANASFLPSAQGFTALHPGPLSLLLPEAGESDVNGIALQRPLGETRPDSAKCLSSANSVIGCNLWTSALAFTSNERTDLCGNQATGRPLLKLNIGTLALIVVAVPLFVAMFWGPPWAVARIAGLAIAIPSIVLLVVARVQLGRSFSVQAKATALVTTGLYSRIRNPIYIFGCLTGAGFLLWANQPWWLLVFAVLIPMQVVRSRKEARVLEQEFGAAYLEYKQKTWF
jgi:protein-S-isoprenylcysteine O-methyltransferase Ste14